MIFDVINLRESSAGICFVKSVGVKGRNSNNPAPGPIGALWVNRVLSSYQAHTSTRDKMTNSSIGSKSGPSKWSEEPFCYELPSQGL